MLRAEEPESWAESDNAERIAIISECMDNGLLARWLPPKEVVTTCFGGCSMWFDFCFFVFFFYKSIPLRQQNENGRFSRVLYLLILVRTSVLYMPKSLRRGPIISCKAMPLIFCRQRSRFPERVRFPFRSMLFSFAALGTSTSSQRPATNLHGLLPNITNVTALRLSGASILAHDRVVL